jgi:hypothetical protein
MLKHSKKAPGCCEWAACRRQKLPVSSNGDFGMSRLKQSSWRTGYITWTGAQRGRRTSADLVAIQLFW